MIELLDKINIGKVLRYGLFMLLSLIAQEMVLGQFRVFGVAPLILPACAVAMGMFKGPIYGPLFSVLLGIFTDMIFVENVIAFTLLFPVISFVAAFVAEFYVNRSFFAFMGASFVALLATGVFQMLKTLAGDSFSMNMITTAVLQAVLSMPAAAVIYFPPAKWIQ